MSMPEIIKPEPSSKSERNPEVNFALVLSRMIDTVKNDPAELRSTIYELARIKLMEQFGREDVKEINRLVQALEAAIEGVEAFSRQEEERVRSSATLSGPQGSVVPADATVAPINQAPLNTIPTVAKLPRRRFGRGFGGVYASLGRFFAVLVAVTIVSMVLIYSPHLRTRVSDSLHGIKTATSNQVDAAKAAATKAPADIVAKPEQAADGHVTAPPKAPALPLPSTFGIYAVSNGALIELKPLPGKVPDQRMAISTAINTPSETVLPTGEIKFIVFRRDAQANAPDRTEIRVIARVTRAMGVDASGKATVTQAHDTWVMRNISFPLKVGPVEHQPEMFFAQPEKPDLVLAPGRYALNIKGQGFDFSVAGQITDPNQCVERVDAANGAFYSPCPGK